MGRCSRYPLLLQCEINFQAHQYNNVCLEELKSKIAEAVETNTTWTPGPIKRLEHKSEISSFWWLDKRKTRNNKSINNISQNYIAHIRTISTIT